MLKAKFAVKNAQQLDAIKVQMVAEFASQLNTVITSSSAQCRPRGASFRTISGSDLPSSFTDFMRD